MGMDFWGQVWKWVWEMAFFGLKFGSGFGDAGSTLPPKIPRSDPPECDVSCVFYTKKEPNFVSLKPQAL